MNRHPPIHIERALPATVAIFATACMTVMSASAATAVERIAVTEIKPLLMRAAERGEAHGVLTGTGAAYLQRRFETASPIEVDVQPAENPCPQIRLRPPGGDNPSTRRAGQWQPCGPGTGLSN
jgi:hypothetical protein